MKSYKNIVSIYSIGIALVCAVSVQDVQAMRQQWRNVRYGLGVTGRALAPAAQVVKGGARWVSHRMPAPPSYSVLSGESGFIAPGPPSTRLTGQDIGAWLGGLPVKYDPIPDIYPAGLGVFEGGPVVGSYVTPQASYVPVVTGTPSPIPPGLFGPGFEASSQLVGQSLPAPVTTYSSSSTIPLFATALSDTGGGTVTTSGSFGRSPSVVSGGAVEGYPDTILFTPSSW